MQNEKMDNAVAAPQDLRVRTLTFSREIIQLAKTLQSNRLAQPLLNQLLRSATSIGANFSEAKDSGSRRDFRNKVLISKKEAAETLYWLELLDEFTAPSALAPLKTECQEIICILRSIAAKVDQSDS